MKRKTIWITKGGGYYWISVDKGEPHDVAICEEAGAEIFKELKIREGAKQVEVSITVKRFKK